jgi:hypothetical protein
MRHETIEQKNRTTQVETSMTIQSILNQKGSSVLTIEPSATIKTAAGATCATAASLHWS